MNDVTYVEAARALAERVMMIEGGPTPEDRITLAFRLATARRPTPEELKVLLDGYRDHLAHYRANARAAMELIRIGESERNPTLDPFKLAAYTVIAGVI